MKILGCLVTRSVLPLLSIFAVSSMNVTDAAEKEPDFSIFNQAEIGLIGKLKSVRHSPIIGKSDPPVRSAAIEIEEKPTILRGGAEVPTHFQYVVRSRAKPSFDIGEDYIITAQQQNPRAKAFLISAIVPATDDNVKRARQATSLPIGWRLVDGRIISPWAARGKDYWPMPSAAENACSVTGRPPLLAGEDVAITVEQVPPKVKRKFQNPFGDGKFKITVTNTSKMGISVPALLTRDGKVLWHESLVVTNRGEAFVLPQQHQVSAAKPASLAPGQSLSGVVDLLLLDGVKWPRGGSRISFNFCLGEKAAGNFFY